MPATRVSSARVAPFPACQIPIDSSFFEARSLARARCVGVRGVGVSVTNRASVCAVMNLLMASRDVTYWDPMRTASNRRRSLLGSRQPLRIQRQIVALWTGLGNPVLASSVIVSVVSVRMVLKAKNSMSDTMVKSRSHARPKTLIVTRSAFAFFFALSNPLGKQGFLLQRDTDLPLPHEGSRNSSFHPSCSATFAARSRFFSA